MAVSERHQQYFTGYPCKLHMTAEKGRHLLATRDLRNGEEVIVSEAYLNALFPSYKKRICAACLQDRGRRLDIHCTCNQAWYCDGECKAAHAAGNLSGDVASAFRHQVPMIPHSMLCPVLRQFSGLKCDADMDCILRMCLDLLALQQLNSPAADGNTPTACSSAEAILEGQQLQAVTNVPPSAAATAAQRPQRQRQQHVDKSPPLLRQRPPDLQLPPQQPSDPGLPLNQEDFEALQYHPDSMSVRDRQEWTSAAKFLQTALHRAGWPQQLIPSTSVLLMWIGRIAANSFGLHIRGPSQSIKTVTAAEEGDRVAGRQQVAGKQQNQQQQAVSSTAQRLREMQLRQRELWAEAAVPPDAAAPTITVPEADSNGSSGAAGGPTSQDEASASPPVRGMNGAHAHGANSSDTEAPAAANDCAGSGGTEAPAPASQPARTASGDMASVGTVPADLVPAGCADSAAAVNGGVSTVAAEGSSSSGPGWLGVADHVAGSQREPVGRELFITASYFNHSCQPNAIINRQSGFGVVTAQADVKAGTELCISYIDLDAPRSARRAALQKFFHFSCDCSRCQQEAVEGSGKQCYAQSASAKTSAPKRRGRKARVSR